MATRTRIKFCGMTRSDDVAAAAALGVDAVGVVVGAESSRRIDIAHASRILHHAPLLMTPVALFVDAAQTTIVETARQLNVHHVQLHGDESPALVASLIGLRVIKSIRTVGDGWLAHLAQWRGVANLSALLLDSGAGSGLANNFEAIAHAFQQGAFSGLPPIVIAGGLTPENVGSVITLLRPYAVDVSSGIETSKGIKSPQRMQAFVEAVRLADQNADISSA